MLVYVVLAVGVAMVGAQQRPMGMGRGGGGGGDVGEMDDIPPCAGLSIYQTKSEEDEERSRRPCPERAVCADVWNTVRDWFNGTRCRDQRVTFNCRCPDNNLCPIDDPAHVLFANVKQGQYMCEPVCELEACRTGFRAAKEMVRPMERPQRRRNSYGYYRMNCRCADHHDPLPTRRGRLNRATSYKGLSFDRFNRLIYTQYGCNRYIEDFDPCVD